MGEIVFRKVSAEKFDEVKLFLKKLGLSFDDDIEYTLAAYNGEEIIGTCSFSRRVIKCFGTREDYKGEGIAARLITEITNEMFDRGIKENLVFTKNENRSIFLGLGFAPIIQSEEVTLFEGGFMNVTRSIADMFEQSGLSKGPKAGLVMNCNPFTLGHRYLIETASKENDEVVVFVVEEDSSVFPFKTRMELVKAGTEDLENVHVIPGGSYIISRNTFPTYFLKQVDEQLKAYTEIDAGIYGKYIAPCFNLKTRYVGEEPFDKVTAVYNEALLRILPNYGVKVKCIKRLTSSNNIISASYVRKLMRKGEFSTLAEFVPGTTLEFLRSEGATEIINRIKEEGP